MKKDYTFLSLQKRLLCILCVVAFAFLLVICKLFFVTVVQSKDLQTKAVDQWTRDLSLCGVRGSILDTNDVVLANSYTSYNVYVRPSGVDDAQNCAQTLSTLLGLDKDKILEKISNKKVSEVLIDQQVSSDLAHQILKADLNGVYLSETSTRQYPYGDLLTSVLGFTTIDNIGQSGLEAYYDRFLTGTNGYSLTDGTITGVELSNATTEYVAGISGCNINLTIDVGLQQILEGVLDRAIVEQKATSALGIMMNAKTGEILSMSTKPSFDLNNIPRDDVQTLMKLSKNTTVTDVYEPGSTFKIFTMASALSLGVTTLEETFFDPGYRVVDGQKIKCWKTKGHGSETLVEAFSNSCNSVFMDLGLRMGTEKFYQYLSKFGIGQKTGIDYAGESGGIMMNQDLVKNVDLARISFGQAVAVTPIQMITGICGVVNGTLYQPRLIKSVTSNNITKTFESVAVRNTVSEDVRQKMNYLLEQVLSVEGECTFVTGYHIGGKTGTAQKYEDGKVASGKYISSFVGTYPASDPQYVLLLCVNEPSNGIYYGGQVAKPYGKDIFIKLFNYFGIAPDLPEMIDKTNLVSVPNLIGMSIMDACALLKSMKLDYYFDEDVQKVSAQSIPDGELVEKGTIIVLY